MNNSQDLRLGVWHGEGIGPEIVGPTMTAVTLALQDIPVEFVPLELGLSAFEATGQIVPDATWRHVEALDSWILGPHDNASYPAEARGQLNPSAALRKRADLWANIRPVSGVPGAVHPDLDVVVVRENTEGMYADRNMFSGSGDISVTPDMALAIGVFTTEKIRRIVRRAAQMAVRRGGVLTVAHKSNVLAETSGRYVTEARACAEEFGIEIQPVHIDALCAELVTRPQRYRTIVAENMFGDILSDLIGGLGGSLGIAGSINAGDEQVMAQATHGAAPDIAGQGIANPAAMMNSAAQLLIALGYEEAGTRLHSAVESAVVYAPTRDLFRGPADGVEETGVNPEVAGPASTQEFADHVFAQLKTLV